MDRDEAIMLKNLPIILFRTAQNFHRLCSQLCYLFKPHVIIETND